MNPSESKFPSKNRHKGWWVLSGVAILSFLMAGLTSYTYRQTDVHLAETYERVSALGANATAEQCIDDMVQWIPKCDGMKALCEGAVPRVMASCLKARDRSAECQALINRPADAHFGFKECAARGLSRSLNKVCGNSYKALDLHCRDLGYPPASIEQ
ncbi:MAG: hypothetical protein RJB13_620 [Pseudomonadota bacterium]|jgi:hypothetical protein